jgi:hypothetical protein
MKVSPELSFKYSQELQTHDMTHDARTAYRVLNRVPPQNRYNCYFIFFLFLFFFVFGIGFRLKVSLGLGFLLSSLFAFLFDFNVDVGCINLNFDYH